ncbi:MAG: alpha/beta hydrolase-fold protein [Candidatus Sumerlaeia bacterium]
MQPFFPELQVIELSQSTIGKEFPVIQWVSGDDSAWRSGEPVFEMKHPEIDLAARGWVAVSNESILFHIRVQSPSHENHQSGYHIYDGDSIQIGIDARGDGSHGLPLDTRYVGPDDGYFGFALTDSGKVCWVYQMAGDRGTEYHGSAIPDECGQIHRDPEKGETIYDIAIPWKMLNTPAGFSGDLGVCVQVNKGSGRYRQVLRWGETSSGNPQPGKMQYLRLSRPEKALCTALVAKHEVWHRGDFGEIIISLWPDHGCRIHARQDKRERDFQMHNGGSPEVPRHYSVRATPPSLNGNPVDFEVQLFDNRGEMRTRLKTELSFPGEDVNRLRGLISRLEKEADHPMVRDSLDSLRQAVEHEWKRSADEVQEKGVPLWGRKTLNWCREYLNHMSPELANWDAYLKRRQSLIVTFPSEDEEQLRLYKVRLPRDYDPEKTYPAVFVLHGRGIVHMLQHTATDISPLEKNTYLSEEYQEAAEFFEFRLFVGELGYRDAGEDCFWEEVQDIEERFPVDPDRRYLIGSSMGGMGTWSIGLRTPDRWAALAINAAGPNYLQGDTDKPDDATIGLGRNASGLPISISHGAADLLVPPENAQALANEIRKWGQEPRLDIMEGFGHGFPPGKFDELLTWMMRYERKRPQQFRFVADRDRYCRCWGITMRRDPAISTAPSFTCTIEEKEVHIDSEGTEGLEVDLEKLRLDRKITLYWNGQKAWHGSPTKKVKLGKGPQ